MSKKEVIQTYISKFHGSYEAYFKAVEENHTEERATWTRYLIALCANGLITDKQLHTWRLPSKRGIPVSNKPAAVTA